MIWKISRVACVGTTNYNECSWKMQGPEASFVSGVILGGNFEF